MASTTVDALRTAVGSTVEVIVPEYVRLSAHRFHQVAEESGVGAGLRSFSVVIEEGLEFANDRGHFSSEVISYGGQLRVVCGYGQLQDNEFRSMQASDQRQIYQVLATANITGLELITPRGFAEAPTSKEGARTGSHVFDIDFQLSNRTS